MIGCWKTFLPQCNPTRTLGYKWQDFPRTEIPLMKEKFVFDDTVLFLVFGLIKADLSSTTMVYSYWPLPSMQEVSGSVPRFDYRAPWTCCTRSICSPPPFLPASGDFFFLYLLHRHVGWIRVKGGTHWHWWGSGSQILKCCTGCFIIWPHTSHSDTSIQNWLVLLIFSVSILKSSNAATPFLLTDKSCLMIVWLVAVKQSKLDTDAIEMWWYDTW